MDTYRIFSLFAGALGAVGSQPLGLGPVPRFTVVGGATTFGEPVARTVAAVKFVSCGYSAMSGKILSLNVGAVRRNGIPRSFAAAIQGEEPRRRGM